jgi:hypothetical protein
VVDDYSTSMWSMGAMKITISAKSDGSTTVHVASVISDLWDDYCYFRDEAAKVDRRVEPLHYKRCVRASIMAFFNYFEGVLN